VERFRYPRARFDAARVLAEAGVRCVMDLSDGLAGDAAHIARAAGVSVELDASAAARDPDFLAFCRAHGLDPERTALEGGEDYELLFACPEERFEALGPRLPGAVRVGRCRPFSGSPVANLPDGIRSFHHGRR
jgi:thiamine-monophosphate kinase